MTDQPDPYAPPPGGGQPPPGHAPQYGQPPYAGQFGQGPYRQPGTNGFAIASLICAFFCSPLGIVFGFVARSQIRRTGQGGDGLALAGIILSFVFIGIALVAGLASAAGSGGTYGLDVMTTPAVTGGGS